MNHDHSLNVIHHDFEGRVENNTQLPKLMRRPPPPLQGLHPSKCGQYVCNMYVSLCHATVGLKKTQYTCN